MIPGNCDNVVGHCKDGCQAGWKNTQCDQGKIWNVIKNQKKTCRTFVSCQPQNEISSLRPTWRLHKERLKSVLGNLWFFSL